MTTFKKGNEMKPKIKWDQWTLVELRSFKHKKRFWKNYYNRLVRRKSLKLIKKEIEEIK